MARTRYKHFKSVVICQCELKVVFLSARSFQSLSAIAQLNSLLSAFMRPVLILFHMYVWYYENLMIHWKRERERERDWVCWGRLKLYPTIPVFQKVSNEYEEKLFMKSFQWLNWIHFRKNDPARETMKRYVWSKTSWFHFLYYYSLFMWRNWSLLKGWEYRYLLLLVCTLILIWLHLEDELL